jgi:predicted enzyme related to lactoylglutathione lyase
MVDYPGHFAWYELITTDMAAAKTFYAEVVGWSVQDASTPDLTYTLFTSEGASVGGLMDLPEEARKLGATPRWMGYVGVNDVDATADRIKRLGGALYVPPTNTNIGRISVVADPQAATLGLVKGLKPGQQKPAELGKPGRVGWHELLAADREKAFAFYGELFGWQKAAADVDPNDTYQLFSAGGRTIGGTCAKRPMEPVPYWLYYFNIGDIDAAMERVKTGGGQVFEGPLELPSGTGFHRKAGWSTHPAARRESRIRDTSRISQSGSGWPGRRHRRFGGRLVLLFRPGDVVGDDGHDRYSRHADENLREQRA